MILTEISESGWLTGPVNYDRYPKTFLCATLATTAVMTIIVPTIDGPYLPTNSPPSPTLHLTLNVCEALHHPSLCEARDVKDEDKLVHCAYGLFSGK